MDAFVAHVLDLAYPAPIQRRKRAWVLVNPHAGPGGADKIFEKKVRPIFEAARMPLTVVRTTYSGEAVTLAQDLDISEYDIAIPCSGDGLPHEVFNGLSKRPDARKALSKLAVCHIPCGSGNAMSCNLYGTHRPSLAALAIVKGVPTKLDLCSVTLQDGERLTSFLSQAYGLIADLDITTEHLRWMGAARFTYGFLTLAIRKKTYPCDVAMKVEVGGKEEIRGHYARGVRGAESEVGNGEASGDGEEGGSNDGEGEGEGEGMPGLKYGTVNDELPEDWEVVPHEKLGSFYCGNVCFLLAPFALPVTLTASTDGLHGPRRQLLLCRPRQRWFVGPHHHRRRHLPLEEHQPPTLGRIRPLLRQPLGFLSQGLRFPLDTPIPGPEWSDQHRWRSATVCSLPGGGTQGPGADPQ